MRLPRHENIPVELEHVKPLGDFVLVKRLPDDADHTGLIWLPQTRQNRELGARRGKVLACGPGDKAVEFVCSDCSAIYTSTIHQSIAACPQCGSDNRHWHLLFRPDWTNLTFETKLKTSQRPMHCIPGDEILYVRAPANDIKLNGEEYTFLHEEQHVLAVLERAA